MADARQISRQEQLLADAQKQVERAKRLMEEAVKRAEREAQILADMQKAQADFTVPQGTTPQLSQSSPASFQSQYDQFSSTKSNERLRPATGSPSAFEYIGKPSTPKLGDPQYSHGDRDQHWSNLMDMPDKPVYASGRYISSGHGTYAIDSPKEYEYLVSAAALPLSVGDTVRVPVNPTRPERGKRGLTTAYLQMQITDIYTKERFHPYHNKIEV